MILFPDTNFFLHFKDPTEIPWSEVTSDNYIRIIICSNTQVELDKKKFELRGRAKQRARKWTANIGKIISTECIIVLQDDGPRITVELFLERPDGWTAPSTLNATALGDDSFVADVLAFKASTGEDCALLSADTGPLGKAKRYGVPIVSAMRDGWELPEETDDRDKQIGHLRKALEDANKRGPIISTVTTVNDAPISNALIDVLIYPDLSEENINKLCKELEDKYPIITDISRTLEKELPSERKYPPVELDSSDDSVVWTAPTDEQILTYRASYEQWLADARKIMLEVPASLQEQQFETTIDLAISNIGTEPAENVLISFEVSGGIILRDEKDKDQLIKKKPSKLKLSSVLGKALRSPPKPPEWKRSYRVNTSSAHATKSSVRLSDLKKVDGSYAGAMGKMFVDKGILAQIDRNKDIHSSMYRGLGGIRDPLMARLVEPGFIPSLRPLKSSSRDPELFYWKERSDDELSSHWEFECKLLRHHIEPETWRIPIVVKVNDLKGGALTVNIHAGNLQRPTKFTIPVRLNVRYEDTEDFVRMLLPEAMHSRDDGASS